MDRHPHLVGWLAVGVLIGSMWLASALSYWLTGVPG